jgi:hypothetical protein
VTPAPDRPARWMLPNWAVFALKVIGGSAALIAIGLVFYVRGRRTGSSVAPEHI